MQKEEGEELGGIEIAQQSMLFIYWALCPVLRNAHKHTHKDTLSPSLSPLSLTILKSALSFTHTHIQKKGRERKEGREKERMNKQEVFSSGKKLIHLTKLKNKRAWQDRQAQMLFHGPPM